MAKYPNDIVAKESFNQFLLSLRGTNATIWSLVTNPTLSEMEAESIRELYEKKEPKLRYRRKSREDEDEDFHPGDHFTESDIQF